MQGGEEVKVHYVRSGQPHRIEEHFDGYDQLDSDFMLAHTLQVQETTYCSFETSYANNQLGSSSSAAPKSNPHQNGDDIRILSEERDKFDSENVELQLANDKALAFALQEMENQTSDPSVIEASQPETNGNTSGNGEINSTARTSQMIIQDDIDPDNMTYEELQSLGEAIGMESRGLPDELIAYLPSSKYKAGTLFFRNNRHEECVICRMEYKKGERLITLPCQHLYHADCATRWLRVNKVCPVCSAEVFGS